MTKFLSMSRRVRSVLRQGNKPRFVAAFCQTNCGDVSPNVLGAFCIDTGLPCDFNHSTCGGKNELCYGRGPGYAKDYISCKINVDLAKRGEKILWVHILTPDFDPSWQLP